MESRNQEHQLGRYSQCVSTAPETMHSNGERFRRRHAVTHDIDEHLKQMARVSLLETNQPSRNLSACHNAVHKAAEVDHLKVGRLDQ